MSYRILIVEYLKKSNSPYSQLIYWQPSPNVVYNVSQDHYTNFKVGNFIYSTSGVKLQCL